MNDGPDGEIYCRGCHRCDDDGDVDDGGDDVEDGGDDDDDDDVYSSAGNLVSPVMGLGRGLAPSFL